MTLNLFILKTNKRDINIHIDTDCIRNSEDCNSLYNESSDENESDDDECSEDYDSLYNESDDIKCCDECDCHESDDNDYDSGNEFECASIVDTDDATINKDEDEECDKIFYNYCMKMKDKFNTDGELNYMDFDTDDFDKQ
jgi:hypothetical protein